MSYDLQIFKGASYSLSLTLNDTNGVPLDLTNCLVSGCVRNRYSDTGVALDLKPTVNNPPTSGMISLNVSGAQTAQLPINLCVYDIDVINTGNGIITQALAGLVYVYPGVSI